MGLLIGKANKNPLLDTRVYEVEMPDGTYAGYYANNLIESIYNSVDENDHAELFLDDIIDHQVNGNTVPKQDGWVRSSNSASKRVITTRGWDLKILWKDDTSTWIPLKDIKEVNPVEVAEYAVRANIANEPAFACWVNGTIKRCNKIIKKVRHRLAKKSHKFGIKVPNSIQEVLSLDQDNGNYHVKEAFKLIDEGERLPAGSKEIPYHISFDVKLDLTRKA